jgi:thiol-disulfide isomerase/thioredoxin
MGRLAPAIGFIVAIVAVAITFGALSTSEPSDKKSTSVIAEYLVNEKVPSVVVYDKTNKAVTLDSALPDKTLVTFWDATCGECRVGLPLIAGFAAEHPEIRPIYINRQNTPEQASQLLAELGLQIETLYDRDGSAFTAWSGTTPATYFIRNGTIRVFFPGRPNTDQLDALLTVN